MTNVAESTRDLLNFVEAELLDGETFGTDENLLGDGAVDSLGMMRLVAFVEDHFSLMIPPEDLTLENFSTIDAIAGYLHSRADPEV